MWKEESYKILLFLKFKSSSDTLKRSKSVDVVSITESEWHERNIWTFNNNDETTDVKQLKAAVCADRFQSHIEFCILAFNKEVKAYTVYNSYNWD